MEVGPGELGGGPWRVEPLEVFARSLAEAAGCWVDRPRIIAVDGRGGSGKTALAGRLCGAMAGAAVVHSDDVAWAHSRFGWGDLMVDGVLEPLRAGRGVRYQPPAWRAHGRDGRIEVPADARTVIIEGVHRDMRTHGRDEGAALQAWDEWEAEEVPFLLEDRPWERAHFVVATASSLPHDPRTEVMVALPAGPR